MTTQLFGSLPFFVVGIGASAGGLKALTEFFLHMPPEPDMAFVIVLHLSPKYESEAASILQTKTSLRVVQVNATIPIEKNCIYVISPANDLFMNDGCLQVAPTARPRGRHTAIDLFMRSLAEAHRSHAIGIILSGGDSDGAVGITRLKETGGVAIAQSPEEAESDSMPRNAIATGMVDMVLPVAQMPEALLSLVANATSIHLRGAIAEVHGKGTDDPFKVQENALLDILLTLRVRTGHDFANYKRGTVLRRIERRLEILRLTTVTQYRDFFEQNPNETALLLQDMLISVTNFFRDSAAFDTLEREVMPALFAGADATEQIRAWSVACATGEEAYSIAMLMAEQNARLAQPRSMQVLASDISENAIVLARRGTYPASIATDVSDERLKRWFFHLDERFGIRNEIRENMLFALHNVLHDPPFSRLHLISCRNFLIYVRKEIQRKVFELLHYALRPNGYLFLGASESADTVPDLFIPIDKKHRIYQALPVKAGSRQLPAPLLMVDELPTPAQMVGVHAERTKPPAPELHRRLIEDYGMPTVLVDSDGTLVYLTKSASHVLQWPSGEPSHNILEMLAPEMQLELRPTLFQASQSRQNVTTRRVPVQQNGKPATMRIHVRPIQDAGRGDGMMLVIFDVVDVANDIDALPPSGNDAALLSQYDDELKYAKEQLRLLGEQYSVALQDAKATNEELQAVNEELGSTMEELETSREELQSTNEELLSVNYTLKSKAEDTAKASDDLQNFLAASEIATIFIDRQYHIQRYTKPAASIFNLIPTDVGRPLFHITHYLKFDNFRQDVAQVFATLQPIEREIQSQQGKWYIARLLPYATAEHAAEGLILTFIEISRRRIAEENVRLLAERMRLISASTRDYAIVTLDGNGLVTSWNAGAEAIFGYTEQDMLGHSAELLLPTEDRQAHVFQDELARATQTGRAENQLWYVRKDGAHALCSGITSPLVDSSQGGYIKIVRDLTRATKEKEEQVAALSSEKAERSRAEEGARVRDEFFAVLSHELKQPLNLIQLSAEMLSLQPEATTSPAIARSADTIKRMVEGQAKIIDDLMDLSRLHTGKLTLKHTRVNLGELVEQVVSLMTQDAGRKKIHLSLEQAPEALIIHGDAVRIEQVILNLINNALKFTPAGGEVRVRLGRAGAEACMEVRDTGKGIAPQFVPFIFDMFRQADTGTTRQYGGLGIGLALVKELVEGHGGRTEVQSEGIGKGAQFRVFLPLTISWEPGAPVILNRENRLSGKQLLIVDDSVEMLQLLGGMLKMEGAQVTMASSSADALKGVEGHSAPFHLIISDIGMPGMDGYALLAELRKRDATSQTPAIALSGFTAPKDVQAALSAGFAAHVGKPVSIEQLILLACSLST